MSTDELRVTWGEKRYYVWNDASSEVYRYVHIWRMADAEDGDPLTYSIIGEAMRVRKALGCRLLESAYHTFFCHALRMKNFSVESNAPIPVTFEGVTVKVAFRCDLIVERQVIVEVKAVSEILPVHKAQLLTYMRLAGIRKGLLINFNAIPFSSGIVRMVLDEPLP